MHRFFISTEGLDGGSFTLEDPKVIKHARKILRLKSGDVIELFDGKGGLYTAEISIITKNEIAGGIIDDNSVSQSGIEITLAQACPKGAKLDDVIRMNTEVGVDSFVLFESEYGVVKVDTLSQNKLDRLNRIAVDAARQSEQMFVPKIEVMRSFREIITTSEYDFMLMLYARPGISESSIYDIKNKLTETSRVLVLIGPEGGFSDIEVEQAKESGVELINLNLPILRTQTAGVVVNGILLS